MLNKSKTLDLHSQKIIEVDIHTRLLGIILGCAQQELSWVEGGLQMRLVTSFRVQRG